MRRFAVLAACLALSLGMFATASARPVRLDAKSFSSASLHVRSGGFASGRALDLAVGDVKLTAGATSGGLSSIAQSGVRRTPVIDESVLVPCTLAGAVVVS